MAERKWRYHSLRRSNHIRRSNVLWRPDILRRQHRVRRSKSLFTHQYFANTKLTYYRAHGTQTPARHTTAAAQPTNRARKLPLMAWMLPHLALVHPLLATWINPRLDMVNTALRRQHLHQAPSLKRLEPGMPRLLLVMAVLATTERV